ncbi:MAG: aminotransferase class III-fold pyridoxal phosphate-dependent enzyme, partial [Pseudomonadota bacterium]
TLDEEEIALLAPLIAMRLGVSVTNAAIMRTLTPENAHLQISEAPAWRLLDYLGDVGDGLIEAEIRAACRSDDPSSTAAAKKSLLVRRRKIAPGNQALFYAEPLRLVRGERHFLYDADGAEYLDVYNNVPHVGHANRRVVDAASRQLAKLNVNTRYLQDIHVDYAERMLARLPASLTKIVFLNSASEANELALRLARAATGARDMIVMDHCYHGATTGAMDISPYKFNHAKSLSAKPDWVHVAPLPDIYRGARRGPGAAEGYVADLKSVIEGASSAGRKIAGFISECVPSVGGQIVLPGGYLAAAYHMVRDAGGVAIADDVQTALGRLGTHFWGFGPQGVTPDIVVMGKPLGNGYPLAAVAMTEEISAAFSAGPEFFSTFGGSSAACAAGNAVLDVMRDEALQDQARAIGVALVAGLNDLAARHQLIGDVRGAGLFLGVDLVTDRDMRGPATKAASFIKNILRDRRILLGTEGPDDNVLKIRPPMTFDDAAADRLLTELDRALGEAAAI